MKVRQPSNLDHQRIEEAAHDCATFPLCKLVLKRSPHAIMKSVVIEQGG